MTPLLQIDHVTKDYKKGVRANDDITFHVNEGEILGLLGHNGAGKTTLLNQVVGLLRPTQGNITLGGKDAVKDPDMARRFCSFQPQTLAPLDDISPRQAIELMARIRGASKPRAKQRAAELIHAVDIEEWAHKTGQRISGGVKRLTAFAMAAAEPGRLLMFDEPTNDVDPVRRKLLWEEIRKLADDGRAVVLVTHNVIEAERAVDRLVILDQGKVVAHGTPAELRGDDGDRLRLEIVATDGHIAHELATRYPDAVVAGRRVVTSIPAAASPEAIATAQQARLDGQVEEFAIAPVGLEDVYVRLSATNNREDTDAALVA